MREIITLFGTEYVVTDVADVEYDAACIEDLVGESADIRSRLADCEVVVRVLEDGIPVATIYLEEDRKFSTAVGLYTTDMYSILVLWYSLNKYYEGIERVKVAPHSREGVKKYISVATGDSIRLYNSNARDYVIVKVLELKSRMVPLITKGIK
jgi:hypothetical protein